MGTKDCVLGVEWVIVVEFEGHVSMIKKYDSMSANGSLKNTSMKGVKDFTSTSITSCDGDVYLDPKTPHQGGEQSNLPWGEMPIVDEQSMGLIDCYCTLNFKNDCYCTLDIKDDYYCTLNFKDNCLRIVALVCVHC